VSRDAVSRDAVSRDAEYWRRNVRYVGILLGVWFLVSYGAGILFADALDAYRIPGTGFPVGFWFAQQGSIYVFVVLIFVYVFLMNRLDREYDVDEIDVPAAPAGAGPAGAGSRDA
jgi:putative solute:sodium symporter small subunit